MHPALDELQPIPEPEGTAQKEVYAFFGRCSYYAQVLEQGVVNCAVALHARGLTNLTGDAVSVAFDQADRRTLGHDVDISSNRGREEMIDELRAMMLRLQETDRRFDTILIPLWDALGITPEMRQAELDSMRDEARRIDDSG